VLRCVTYSSSEPNKENRGKDLEVKRAWVNLVL